MNIRPPVNRSKDGGPDDYLISIKACSQISVVIRKAVKYLSSSEKQSNICRHQKSSQISVVIRKEDWDSTVSFLVLIKWAFLVACCPSACL